MKKAVEAQSTIDAWNARHDVGTKVNYWRMAKEGKPSGTGNTRSFAFMSSCGIVVIFVEGCSDYLALSHVEAVEK